MFELCPECGEPVVLYREGDRFRFYAHRRVARPDGGLIVSGCRVTTERAVECWRRGEGVIPRHGESPPSLLRS